MHIKNIRKVAEQYSVRPNSPDIYGQPRLLIYTYRVKHSPVNNKILTMSSNQYIFILNAVHVLRLLEEG